MDEITVIVDCHTIVGLSQILLDCHTIVGLHYSDSCTVTLGHISSYTVTQLSVTPHTVVGHIASYTVTQLSVTPHTVVGSVTPHTVVGRPD